MNDHSLFHICHDILEDLDLTDDQREHIVFMLAAYDSLLDRHAFTYGKPLRTVLEKSFMLERERALDQIRESFPPDLAPWFDRILIALKVNNKELLPPDLHPWFDRLAEKLLPQEPRK